MAQYTTFSRGEMGVLLARYGISPVECEPIEGGIANSSFLVTADTGLRYVVTACDYHNDVSIRDLVVCLDTIGRYSFAGPPPERTVSGRAITNWHGVPVIVKPFIDGQVGQPLYPDELSKVGVAIGDIHRIDPPERTRVASRRIPADWHEVADEWPDALKSLVAAAVGVVDRPEWKELPGGFTHGDIFTDNIVWPGPNPVIIDWETASIDVFILDLAVTIVAECQQAVTSPDGSRRIDPERQEALLSGYHDRRELSDLETLMLPEAVRYASAYIAFSRFRQQVRYPNHPIARGWQDMAIDAHGSTFKSA